ncbi:MAG: FAD-dependent oxidoreductase, partial [Planctomycetota bacterium]
AAIITNQGAYPDKKGEGKAYIRQIGISDDKYIPGLKKIADLIHKYNAIAIQQILHGGRYGGIHLDYCLQASTVPQTLRHFREPRMMSQEQIQQCIQDHVDAAVRAIKAGFDGIELTAFMGYLLANYLSKFTNNRTDEYGGSLENRARFMIELVQKTRKAIGPDKLIIVRLNGEELMDEYGGNTPEECIELMKMAEGAGVDCISIVVGWHESRQGALGRDVPTDQWLYIAEKVKKNVKIPVAFGPRFGDPVLAEKAIKDGIIDFWEVCRPFLADPELLHKVKENRIEDIKPCLGGLVCLARMFRNLPYICTVNPRLGHEVEPEYTITPARVKKKVMVIGGGPAGLECAITAAQRGHQVTIYEKTERLGGQLHAASKEPGGGHVFQDLIRYYEQQIKKIGIKVNLNTEVTSKMCLKIAPDVGIVATGAGIIIPELPLEKGVEILSAYDVLEDKKTAGQDVVILGSERLALVTAEFLATHGKKPMLIDTDDKMAGDVTITFKWRHIAWVKEFGIKTYPGVAIKNIKHYPIVSFSIIW